MPNNGEPPVWSRQRSHLPRQNFLHTALEAIDTDYRARSAWTMGRWGWCLIAAAHLYSALFQYLGYGHDKALIVGPNALLANVSIAIAALLIFQISGRRQSLWMPVACLVWCFATISFLLLYLIGHAAYFWVVGIEALLAIGGLRAALYFRKNAADPRMDDGRQA